MDSEEDVAAPCSSILAASKSQDLRNPTRAESKVSSTLYYEDLVVFICGIAVYSNTLNGDFLHDDVPAVVRNPDVIGNSSISDVFKNDFWGMDIVKNESHKSYRPLCVLTFRLNYYLHGFQPIYFHLTNIILHAVASVFVAVLCRQVVFCKEVNGQSTLAMVVGILFAVHPIHTEAVANIVGRAELLSAIFYLASLLVHKAGLVKESGRLLLLTLVTSGSAMLMKEPGVTCLAIILIIEAFKVSTIFDNWRTPILYRYLARIILIISWTCLLTYARFSIMGWRRPHFATPDNPASKSSSFSTKYLTYLHIIWVNFKLLILPINLSYDWSYGTIPLITSLADFRNVITLLFCVVSIWSVCKILYDSFLNNMISSEAYGILLLIVPFIPCSNLLFPVGYVVAERTLYLPSVGFVILIVSLGKRLYDDKLRTVVVSLLCILFTFYVTQTWLRNGDWRSKETLFLSGLRTTPNNAKVRYNWANYLRETERYEEAVKEYQEVLTLYPLYPGALNNLATILEQNESTLEKAQHLYSRLIRIEPNREDAYMNLARTFILKKNFVRAAEVYIRLMSRGIIPTTYVLALAKVLVKTNRSDYAELLIINILSRFCGMNEDLDRLLKSRWKLKMYHRNNEHCFTDARYFSEAMSLYAIILHQNGLIEESHLVGKYGKCYQDPGKDFPVNTFSASDPAKRAHVTDDFLAYCRAND